MSPQRELIKNQVCLVTGASRGIGRGIALRLAADGYDIVIDDISQNQVGIDSVVAEITAMGRKAIGIACDVTNDVAVDDMIAQIITSTDFGKLNVVCANAGIAKVGSLLDSTASDRKAIFDVNTHGVFNTAIAAARQMIKQGSGGRIISTASIAALRPFPMLGAYSSSKWAVKGFTQVAAMEWARYGIRVNAVAPGIVDSAMWGEIELALGILENRTVEEIRSRYGDERVPLGRFAVPNDIGKLVSFLASSDSEYITGQTMVCDGGVQFA